MVHVRGSRRKLLMKAGRRGSGMTGREMEPYFGLALAVISGKCGYRAAEFTTTLLPNECAASSGCAWCARPVIFQQNPPFCDIGPCAVFLEPAQSMAYGLHTI